ncbi:hypothetical protein [Legionella fairfieldensis]|uniref:hypothetical protein n=1 Tax=Legionella fairfieldensis TaxID=45064 RepID=UPI000490F846|nr:hypothetical protein [Legionella fairfieldensis]
MHSSLPGLVVRKNRPFQIKWPVLVFFVLFKTPNTTNTKGISLGVVVLVAVVEVLIPRIGGIVLRRAPAYQDSFSSENSVAP